MRHPNTALVAILIAVVVISAGRSRVDTVRAQDMKSTMSGVYTTPQATRGEETYMAVCVSCHPAGTYKAVGFKATWKGRPLAELFDQVREKMPKNDPASLSQQEYIQVVAYLLKINDVPPGDTDLPADAESLKKIRIEMPGDERD